MPTRPTRFPFFTFVSSAPLLAALLASGSVVACSTSPMITPHKSAPSRPAPAVEGEASDPPVTTEKMPAAGADATASGSFVFQPAPAGTFAQAVTLGGTVVKTPQIVAIVFSEDPSQQQIIDFTAKLATSKYWADISTEYGVGALTAKPAIVLSEKAPTTIDVTQVGPWLAAKFSGDGRFGAPDSSTLYAIFYPDGTTTTLASSTSCTEFTGFHFETTAGNTPIGYAVIPRCATSGNLSGFDVTSVTASHEALEWATDPFPQSSPAYMSVDDDHAVWGRVFLGELGDLCTSLAAETRPADFGFTVQRIWSNASAQAGHNPCAPVAKDPYFTAFPTTPERIAVRDDFGQNITTSGFKVGVGEAKTIELTMYSDAAVMPWSVQVVDLTQITGGPAEFTYSLDKATGSPGEKLHLTITGTAPAKQGRGFMLYSTLGTVTNLWPVWVTN